MTYSEKLRDPRWQKKQLHILQRDGWACFACKSTTKALKVYHLIYAKRDPWDYPDHCYQTLCGECQKQRQEIADKVVDDFRVRLAGLPTKNLEKAALKLLDASGVKL